MRTEKEIVLKIDEVREKAFEILERGSSQNPTQRTSIRAIRLVINALEFALGKYDDLLILKNYPAFGSTEKI